jgi:hypothetical protein
MLRWKRLRVLEQMCEVTLKSFMNHGELWWRANAQRRNDSSATLSAEAEDIAVAALALGNLAVAAGWIADADKSSTPQQ